MKLRPFSVFGIFPPFEPFDQRNWLCPATKSGGVLCYTLQQFECLSIGLSVHPSVCPSPLKGTYWVGYWLSTCSLFRIGVHRTTQLILTYCWVFCLLLSRNFVWENPNKNITVRPSAVHHLCPLHNFVTIGDNFTKLGTNIKHGQTMCRD